MATRRLIVFARAPVPGRAKTRLAASIGEVAAAGVYARLLYGYLMDLLRTDWPDVDLQLSVASAADRPFFAEAFPTLDLHVQSGRDLGTRLAGAFEEAYAAGARSVIVTTSDTPALDAGLIRIAFQALERTPAVIGPCRDGGYYLLGMRAPGAPLFEGVAWGSDRVLEQTERLARAAGLTMTYLPEHLDVDTGEDLVAWRRTLHTAGTAGKLIDPGS